MNTSKKSKRFNRLAIVIVVLGALSLGLEAMIQKNVIERAVLQGATSSAIIEYLWQQVLPNVLKIIIMVLGFVGIIQGINVLGQNNEKVISESTEEIEDEEFSDFDFVDVLSEEESELA